MTWLLRFNESVTDNDFSFLISRATFYNKCSFSSLYIFKFFALYILCIFLLSLNYVRIIKNEQFFDLKLSDFNEGYSK